MKLIEDDKLIHVDNAGDVIEHFGIKGMKWGQRRVVSARGALRAQKKLNKLQKRVRNGFANEKKIAGMKKSDPKRRELINKNKDLTDMNQKALLRLDRNKTIKKVAGKTAALGVGAAAQYQIMKTTNPEAAAALKRFVKGGAKAATKFAKKNYHKAKYAAGYVAKRSYL